MILPRYWLSPFLSHAFFLCSFIIIVFSVCRQRWPPEATSWHSIGLVIHSWKSMSCFQQFEQNTIPLAKFCPKPKVKRWARPHGQKAVAKWLPKDNCGLLTEKGGIVARQANQKMSTKLTFLYCHFNNTSQSSINHLSIHSIL